VVVTVVPLTYSVIALRVVLPDESATATVTRLLPATTGMLSIAHEAEALWPLRLATPLVLFLAFDHQTFITRTLSVVKPLSERVLPTLTQSPPETVRVGGVTSVAAAAVLAAVARARTTTLSATAVIANLIPEFIWTLRRFG
jgi:hypothetical protein